MAVPIPRVERFTDAEQLMIRAGLSLLTGYLSAVPPDGEAVARRLLDEFGGHPEQWAQA